MSLPLVTIMIPTYNQEEYIARAIDSALAQDYENLEVVVSDDMSSDKTWPIVCEYSGNSRLTAHRNLENVGRVSNYRRCLYELARGDYALMLDGDDYFLDEHYISRAVALLASNKDVVLVFANSAISYPGNSDELVPQKENQGLPALIDGINLFLRLPTEKISLFHRTCVYDRKMAMRLSFYRSDIVSSDRESLHRLIILGKVAHVDDIVAVWRMHSENASQKLSLADRIDNLEAILGPYNYVRESMDIDLNTLRSWRNTALIRAGSSDVRALAKACEFSAVGSYLRNLIRLDTGVSIRVILSFRVCKVLFVSIIKCAWNARS